MKCSRVRERLMDYIPAELPPRELQQINMHLVGCEACRAEVEKARKASSALKALANESPYPDLVAAVRTRLAGAGRRRPAIMPGLAIGFSAAAMVALIVTGWLRYGDLDRGAATAEHNAPAMKRHTLPHAYEKLGRRADAISAWRGIIDRFPNDQTARRNLERLENAE